MGLEDEFNVEGILIRSNIRQIDENTKHPSTILEIEGYPNTFKLAVAVRINVGEKIKLRTFMDYKLMEGEQLPIFYMQVFDRYGKEQFSYSLEE